MNRRLGMAGTWRLTGASGVKLPTAWDQLSEQVRAPIGHGRRSSAKSGLASIVLIGVPGPRRQLAFVFPGGCLEKVMFGVRPALKPQAGF